MRYGAPHWSRSDNPETEGPEVLQLYQVMIRYSRGGYLQPLHNYPSYLCDSAPLIWAHPADQIPLWMRESLADPVHGIHVEVAKTGERVDYYGSF